MARIMNLSPAQLAAVEKIGRRRRSCVRVPQDVSWVTARSLKRRGLVMLYSYPPRVMFTYQGERLWTQLHPTSKYKVKL
jgi:hypothetical protein